MKKAIFFLLLFSYPAFSDLKTAKGCFLKWEFKEAQLYYEEELKKTNNPEILFPLCICYQKQGNLLKFRDLKTNYPELRDGIFFFYNGEYKKAFNVFSKDKSKYSYIGMGMVKKAGGDFKQAERLFLKAKPFSLSYIKLGELYLLLDKESSFLTNISEGIKKTRDIDLFLMFAKYLNSKSNYDEALNILKKITKDEPENIIIKEEMLKTLMSLGTEEEGIFSIINASKIDRTYLEGCFCAFTQSYIRAFRQFSLCDFPLAKIRALWMCKEIGWRQRGKELYKEISITLSGDGLSDVHLAEIYAKMGSYTEGFGHLKNALKKEPDLEIAHFALGNLYYLNNDFIKAFFSYKKGFNLSDSKKYFWAYLEDAFIIRYLPLFSLFYIALFLITLILLFITHFVGKFIVRGYLGLKRYIVRKKWLIWLYLIATGIFFIALLIGGEKIRFVPLIALKEIFLILIIYLFISVIIPIFLILTVGTLIKWPKLKIYLLFFLLDNSLDVTIVLGFAALFPIFIQYPQIYETFSFSFIILRRFGLLTILLAMFLFYVWFNRFVLKGYKMVELNYMDSALERFKNGIFSIKFIKWLEPTYSDMASSCILGMVFILLKKAEIEKIEELWKPLLESLNEWWPLNTRAKFLYDWSIILSLIMQDRKSDAKERLNTIASIPEYRNKGGISFLFELLGEAYKEKKREEKYLSFIMSYVKDKGK